MKGHYKMSNEWTKERHSKRIHETETHIKKQVKIAKAHGAVENSKLEESGHYLAKRHAMNCGNPNCVMCGNPRKVWKEKTIQEKKFEQTEGWDD